MDDATFDALRADVDAELLQAMIDKRKVRDLQQLYNDLRDVLALQTQKNELDTLVTDTKTKLDAAQAAAEALTETPALTP